jgi:flagellar basal body-associated protein FliL
MKKDGKRLLIALVLAFFMLLAVIGGYAWFLKKEKLPDKKPVAVCGKSNQS